MKKHLTQSPCVKKCQPILTISGRSQRQKYRTSLNSEWNRGKLIETVTRGRDTGLLLEVVY